MIVLVGPKIGGASSITAITCTAFIGRINGLSVSDHSYTKKRNYNHKKATKKRKKKTETPETPTLHPRYPT
jgi:predicted histidine transporter YuiF (NhaC family)